MVEGAAVPPPDADVPDEPLLHAATAAVSNATAAAIAMRACLVFMRMNWFSNTG
jgi:hypothetical protein